MGIKKETQNHRFPIVIFTLAFIVTFITLALLAAYSISSVRMLKRQISVDMHAVELRGLILHLDEVLRMSAQLGAITGDPKWEKRYNAYGVTLDNAIEEASTIVRAKDAYIINETKAADHQLDVMEEEIFRLTKQGKRSEAKAILSGEEYLKQTRIYSSGMDKFGILLSEYSKHRIIISERRVTFVLIAISISAILLLAAWVLILKSVNRWKISLESALESEKKYKNKIVQARDLLEQRVNERTLQLEEKNKELHDAAIRLAKLHDELMIAARKAGMADISANVVHNIGNILNSQIVAVEMLSDKMKESKMLSLSKMVTLMNQPNNELGDILQKNPKSQDFAKYLTLLSATLSDEYKIFTDEIRTLEANAQLVKDIVNLQGSMSAAVNVLEETNIKGLIEDILLLYKASLDHENIIIERHYTFDKKVYIDKVKTLQILDNLIKNSIAALVQDARADKILKISLAEVGKSNFEIKIEDNGVGISPDNLTKIFSNGFFGGKEGSGSGFGLHMSALAAIESGGSLVAESVGLGHGSCFILTLPQRSNLDLTNQPL